MENSPTDKFSLRKRIKSFGFAFQGIYDAFRTGHNLWVQSAIAILVILCGFYIGVSSEDWILLVLAIGIVFTAELFNTAIEGLVDLVSPEYNKKAGFIKDVAAGAVLIAAITSAVIGLIVFVPYLLSL